ncbi:MAG: hypothetical protein V5A13_02300 [Haloarculaceae archaeon]
MDERSESIGVPVGDTPEEVADHVEDLLWSGSLEPGHRWPPSEREPNASSVPGQRRGLATTREFVIVCHIPDP